MLCHVYNCIDCIQPFYFPLDNDNTVYYGKGYKKEPHPYNLYSYTCPLCGKRLEYCYSCDLDMDTCKIIGDSMWVDKERERTHPSYEITQSTTPTITCPYCQSTNTKKISGTTRWLATGLFGLGSKKIGKQWHCNNCGSDF